MHLFLISCTSLFLYFILFMLCKEPHDVLINKNDDPCSSSHLPEDLPSDRYGI